MKIIGSPMVALRAAAVDRVNEHFNTLASRALHRDAAHAAKRVVAAAVLAGNGAPDEFTAEADLRGLSAAELAAAIITKPNDAAARELNRQRLLLTIAAAFTPADFPVL